MSMRRLGRLLAIAAVLFWLAACAAPTLPPAPTSPSAQQTAAPQPTAVPMQTQAIQPTPAPPSATSPSAAQPTSAPVPTSAPAAAATATPLATAPPLPTAPVPAATATTVPSYQTAVPTSAPFPTAILPTPTAIVEAHVVELEWPPQMRLGDSDLVRLALVPSKEGYVVTTEFPEHQVVTSTVTVARPGGYDLSAVARLDGVGFDLAPAGEQVQGLPLDTTVTWRWTLTPRSAGRQRLSLTLTLRWTPQAGRAGAIQDTRIYSRGIEIQVSSFLGLTTSQATLTGLAGLFFGGTLSLPLTAYLLRPRRTAQRARVRKPDAALALELHPGLTLEGEEQALLRAIFERYGRLVVEAEFRSGYSGARTFLAQPIRPDGRADAHTIVKIGERAAIEREAENYATFVKDTLPPITARIQEAPATLPQAGSKAALRYTFIAEPGRRPTSLREALLVNPDPALLDKLFDTFGPNWWMQRRPYTFRLAQEYDRLLPAHFVLQPSDQKAARVLDGRAAPADVQRLAVGDVVEVRGFTVVERRPDGRSLSLAGPARPGQPPWRLRWLSLRPPERGRTARIVATRETLLREMALGFDRRGLPDPMPRLPALLSESVAGTQSTIHGDLNLENILVGPGGFVWLIDFAETRDGHPLFDFAHLEAQIIAHVLAPQWGGAWPPAEEPLRPALRAIALRCLFNPSQPREYDLALCLACLGALKYTNLDAHQKHLLYLTAAHLAQSL